MEKYIMSTAYEQVMAELKAEKAKYFKEKKARRSAARVEAKKFKKEQSRLTKQVYKAGHQAPSSLECNSPKNMYYSDSETKSYLAGTSYMDTYNSMKNDWD